MMTDIATSLNEALDVLMRMSARKDEPIIRLEAKAGNQQAQRLVKAWDTEDGSLDDYPRYRADGSPIETLDEVVAAMGTTRRIAAQYVMDYKDDETTPSLLGEAQQEMSKPTPTDHTGWFLGLVPRDVSPFVVPNGVPEEEIHCTLFYSDTLIGMEDGFVQEAKGLGLHQIKASANGQTVFYNNPEGKIPFVMNVDSPDLEAARKRVMSVFGAACESEHGYSPHITVGYIDRTAKTPTLPRTPVQVVFDTLRVNANGIQFDIPLAPDDAADGADVPDEDDMELKVRHVRTPAGVARFHEPIGSPIIDHGGSIVRKQRSKPEAIDFDKHLNDYVGAFGAASKEFTKSVPAGKKGWKAKVYNSPSKDGTSRIAVVDTSSGRTYTKTLNGRGNMTSAEISKAVKDLIASSTHKSAARKNYGSPVFSRDDWGVRGVDWNYDGQPTHDWSDMAARKKVVEEDEAELGIIIPPINGGGRAVAEPPMFVREQFLSAMRQYEDWWPGFSELIPQYGAMPAAEASVPSSYVAYNRSLLGMKSEYAESEIMYNGFQFYSLHDSEDKQQRVASEQLTRGTTHGFWAGNGFDLADKLGGDSSPRSMAMANYAYVTHHEIGHTISRYLRGSVWGGDIFGIADQLQGEGTSKKFREAVDAIVLKHHDSNSDAVRHAVSEYGTQNEAEMFSETWASYMLDEHKTELVQEIGELMDASMSDLMKAWQ